MYQSTISPLQAGKAIFRGIRGNRIGKLAAAQKKQENAK